MIPVDIEKHSRKSLFIRGQERLNLKSRSKASLSRKELSARGLAVGILFLGGVQLNERYGR